MLTNPRDAMLYNRDSRIALHFCIVIIQNFAYRHFLNRRQRSLNVSECDTIQ